jgi:hypothetical protein
VSFPNTRGSELILRKSSCKLVERYTIPQEG